MKFYVALAAGFFSAAPGAAARLESGGPAAKNVTVSAPVEVPTVAVMSPLNGVETSGPTLQPAVESTLTLPVAAEGMFAPATPLDYADPDTAAAEDSARRTEALFDGGWSPQRVPLLRGEIGWRRVLELAIPGSRANSFSTPYRSAAVRRRENQLWAHHLAYLTGFRPGDGPTTEATRHRRARLALLAARGAKVRAAYGLPPFSSLRPPTVIPGPSVGSGGEADVFSIEGDPSRVVKVFRRAAGPQVQEISAIMNAVASEGHPVAKTSLAVLPDGRIGLVMARYDRSTGWTPLHIRARVWRVESAAAVALADATLMAVGKETQRVLGVDAADWKGGLTGKIDDEYLENFAFENKTGAVVAFDPLALW